MVKVLRIDDSGFVWDVPAAKIAHNRASYYEEYDKDTTFDEEFAFTMADDYEIHDWFFNNMDWEDVAESATLIKQPQPLKAPRLNTEVLATVIDIPDPVPSPVTTKGE